VLTETAYWLGTAIPLLEMVEAGDLIVGLTLEEHTADLQRIIHQYEGRRFLLPTPRWFAWRKSGVTPQ
jgi:hypothetical protein